MNRCLVTSDASDKGARNQSPLRDDNGAGGSNDGNQNARSQRKLRPLRSKPSTAKQRCERLFPIAEGVSPEQLSQASQALRDPTPSRTLETRSVSQEVHSPKVAPKLGADTADTQDRQPQGLLAKTGQPLSASATVSSPRLPTRKRVKTIPVSSTGQGVTKKGRSKDSPVVLEDSDEEAL